MLRNGKHLPQPHSLPSVRVWVGVWVGICASTCVCVCVCVCVCARTRRLTCVHALHVLYIIFFLLFCISFLLCAFFTHILECVGVRAHMCVCVCTQCADWAGVLAIRKTTSGKVHINHVPQLKERNGAEMGGGSGGGGGGEGGGERIMRDCV